MGSCSFDDRVIYNIPVSRMEDYAHCPVVARSRDPRELYEVAAGKGRDTPLAYLQLLDARRDSGPLTRRVPGVPVDLVMGDTEKELALLYEHTPLTARGPVRVTVPAGKGFAGAVRLATSLNFAVKVETGQPSSALVDELLKILDLYLHGATVTQPVEFFHSVLSGLCREESFSLWEIQEEDPLLFRHVHENGRESLAGRFKECEEAPVVFMERFPKKVLEERGECSLCEYFSFCSGYFKWPDGDFPCEGVKRIFATLREAAEELKRDLARSSRKQHGEPT